MNSRDSSCLLGCVDAEPHSTRAHVPCFSSEHIVLTLIPVPAQISSGFPLSAEQHSITTSVHLLIDISRQYYRWYVEQGFRFSCMRHLDMELLGHRDIHLFNEKWQFSREDVPFNS